MKKSMALELQRQAEDVAKWLTNPKRSQNQMAETFEVHSVEPLSESTAAVIMLKNSKKKVALFFFWYESGEHKGSWRWIIPTDAHITGMIYFPDVKMRLERENFLKNFKSIDKTHSSKEE